MPDAGSSGFALINMHYLRHFRRAIFPLVTLMPPDYAAGSLFHYATLMLMPTTAIDACRHHLLPPLMPRRHATPYMPPVFAALLLYITPRFHILRHY